jgi:hypothetical protein
LIFLKFILAVKIVNFDFLFLLLRFSKPDLCVKLSIIHFKLQVIIFFKFNPRANLKLLYSNSVPALDS